MYLIDSSLKIFNVAGNKGGVVASFNILGSPIAIVSSHLNAHQGNVERRNEDFASICNLVDLDIAPFDLLSNFHHIIWAGDLNYRIDQPMSQVIEDINSGNYENLWPYDQLNLQMQLGKAFNGFIEGKINFPPTYKFKKGTNNYDIESKRIPAWCDRVLVRSFDGLQKSCLLYKDCPTVLTSDHHPVYALWQLDVVLPSPPPPPFASIIGVRPFIEISGLTVDIGSQITSVNATLYSQFTDKSAPLTTATGKGRKQVVFPNECVPLLVPESFIAPQYLKTLYVHILLSVNGKTAVAILPLAFAMVDIFRPFTLKAEYKLSEIGVVSGSLRMVSASDPHIREQQLRHQKTNKAFQFESR